MAVADPGFPRGCSGDFKISQGGANSRRGCINLLFCQICAENCMKMKEFGSRGTCVLPMDPPLGCNVATSKVGNRLLYGQFFPENFIKIKQIEQRGCGTHPLQPLGSTNIINANDN